MAFQEKRQQILPDDTRMTNKFDGNDDTSSSGCSTPDLSLKINDGRSLTLAEFVEHIETQTGQVVREMHARVHRRPVGMPVFTPVLNVDRFSGRGGQLVEDIAYEEANRQRLSIHGIISFTVIYVSIKDPQDGYYYF